MTAAGLQRCFIHRRQETRSGGMVAVVATTGVAGAAALGHPPDAMGRRIRPSLPMNASTAVRHYCRKVITADFDLPSLSFLALSIEMTTVMAMVFADIVNRR